MAHDVRVLTHWVKPEFVGKRLELLRDAVRPISRIALLTTGEPNIRVQVQQAEKAAPSLGIKLVVTQVRDADYDQGSMRPRICRKRVRAK